MINVTNLSKFYGAKRALGPVSFQIEDGEAVGFLGLNGAGKTTALRMLACDLRPSSGSISVDGVDAVADPHQVSAAWSPAAVSICRPALCPMPPSSGTR